MAAGEVLGVNEDMPDLKDVKWPETQYPVGPEAIEKKFDIRSTNIVAQRVEYEKSAFVSEGTVILRPLGRKGVTRPIPPGECMITSLARDTKGRIFGATSGRKSHLFVYDPGPEADHVIDLGLLGENCGVRKSLVASSDGRIFAGTRAEGLSDASGKIFCYTPMRDYSTVQMGQYCKGTIEPVATPIGQGGIAAIVIDDKRRRIYGLSTPGGILFAYDLSEGRVVVKSSVDESHEFSDALIVDGEGSVYGAGRWGTLFKYDPDTDKTSSLGIRIPSIKGREMYNRIDSLAFDENSGIIYGGNLDGVLFRFDPQNKDIVGLGKPVLQPRIRALTVGNDGTVYGVGGSVGGMAHLFRYTPWNGETRDLGILQASSERYWHGYEFDAAVTGRHGEIYLGESDRISHLFIYFPPIPKRKSVPEGSIT
jgi:hypothetical protein